MTFINILRRKPVSQTQFPSYISLPSVPRSPILMCPERGILSLSSQPSHIGITFQIRRFRTATAAGLYSSIARQATQLRSLSQRNTLYSQRGYPGQTHGFITYVESGRFTPMRIGKGVLKWALKAIGGFLVIFSYWWIGHILRVRRLFKALATNSHLIKRHREASEHEECGSLGTSAIERDHALSMLEVKRIVLFASLEVHTRFFDEIIWEQAPRPV